LTRTIHTRDLNMHYDFVGYPTLDEWDAWATYLRRHILVSTGLWPEPEKCGLEPEIFGRIERDGYSVGKVYFQSYPGFYVCGNLYRPLDQEGPFPGIISPHGHWSVGRLANEERGSIPGRCINLARQGNVVFTYDMVGYRDSSQIEHRRIEQRRELWGQCNLALQLWNAVRSIDFLQGLPEVDDDRIACTGASGGGTQTFMVMAIDERVKVAAPVNMVSAHMQGGCVCENAPNLRVDTFNTEIAALQAPRPLMLVSATGDWTKNTLVEEGPDVRTIYELHGVPEKVEYVQVDAEHNYNLESREHVYGFMGKWLHGIDDAELLREQPFEAETDEDLLVFADREMPSNALSEEALFESLYAASEKQLGAYAPENRKGLKAFREVYGSSLAHALNLRVPGADDVARDDAGEGFVLSVADMPWTKVHATLAGPESGPMVVVVGDGASDVAGGLVGKGHRVMRIDVFGMGDNVLSAESKQDLESQFYTTYNRTDTALRVQDIVTALVYAQSLAGDRKVSLVGLGEAGAWCLLASAAGIRAKSVVVDMDGLDVASDAELMDKLYTPGLRRAGDVRTAAALWAPAKLALYNSGSDHGQPLIASAYTACESRSKLHITEAAMDAAEIADRIAG